MMQACKAARKAMEDTYSGVLTVTERRKVRNEQTKLTGVEDVVVLLNQPCKLSFESVAPVATVRDGSGREPDCQALFWLLM